MNQVRWQMNWKIKDELKLISEIAIAKENMALNERKRHL